LEYKSVVNANEEKTPEQIMPDKQIEAKTEDLENEIEELKIAFEMKKACVKGCNFQLHLKKNLEKTPSVLMDNMKHVLKLN